MTEEDHDVDIESDFDEDDEDGSLADATNIQNLTPDAKRAHHNALERKRRDHIKESFVSLRNAVPNLQNGRSGKSSSVSRSQILRSATSYIQQMTDKNEQVQAEIGRLKKTNRQLEQQVMMIERTRGAAGTLSVVPHNASDSDDELSGSRIQHKRFKSGAK